SLSFNDRVNIAVSIVTEQYPYAKLYEVDGVALEGPTTDPTKIDHIRWPMDLNRAVQLKEAAGFTEPYKTVTLRNPLGPKRSNPLLIFGYDSSLFVSVDTVTGNVTTIT
ncbi:21632_t:CDS:2, partial [Gigaspora rosea]